MRTFARALVCALIKHLFFRAPRKNHVLQRAIVHVPATKAYSPTGTDKQPLCITTIDPDFPYRWLSLEKRIRTSCWRDEVEYVLDLERELRVTWGKEAAEWVRLRRMYHDKTMHETMI